MTLRKTLLKQGSWFFLFNAVFLLIIASRYFKYFSEADSFLTVFYLIITTVSHFTALSFVLFLVYLPIVLIFPNKTIAWIWAALLASCGCTLLLLDTFVFDLYRMHINSFVLELLFGGAGTQIFEFAFKQYVLYLGFVLVFFIAMLYGTYKFFHWKKVHSFKKGRWILLSIAIMMLGSHFTHAWADAASYIPITKSSRYYPLFFPTTNKELMLKMGIVDEIKSRNNMLLFAENEHKDLNYPKHPIVGDSTVKTNIIIILIDSWYYKAFDSITMPHMYEFSKQCSVYNKHYSGSNGTRTGVFSLFYSIPGTYWDIVLATQTSPMFIDFLLKNNYQIKTFASASLASPPFDRTIFRNVKDIKIETEGNTVCDRDIQMTKDWLMLTKELSTNRNAKPLFSLIFYDALHAISHPADFKGPYQPEWEYPEYESLDNDTDPTPFLNLYKNSANFVDSLVGKVLTDLEEKGLLKNSWVIITGDHGQEFNDNKKNYWGHNGNYSAAQMQVPTLIYKPGRKHQVYRHWTSHYDIVPTIMTDLFHCKNPIADYSIGRRMNDSTNRDWLLIGSSDNFAILQPNRINTVNFDGSYDITDSKLNPLKGAKLETGIINKIMFTSKSYYAK